MRIVLATGGFDPLHSGHLDYLCAARQLGDELVVGVNSEDWLLRKKGGFFMPTDERVRIVQSLQWVDSVILFDDGDDSANSAIRWCLTRYGGHQDFVLIFANGGDRTAEEIPEITKYGLDNRVRFVFNVGGSKSNSSSEILSRWTEADARLAQANQEAVNKANNSFWKNLFGEK